jgi:arylsulfatase A-like enzyme
MSPFNGPEPDASVPTLASLLKAAGYATSLVGKHHLGRKPGNESGDTAYIGAPQARGFDRWLAGTPENVDDFSNWPRVDDETLTQSTEYVTAAQVAAALDWIASTAGPKFIQVSLTAPHGPYNFPPADELGGFTSSATSLNRQKYECEIRSADWAFGQLLAALPAGTIVAVVGDNGTPENARAPGQQIGKLKATCYEGGIRVPLAIKSQYPAGTTDRLVHIADIPATLLALAGVSVPNDWDGKSLIGPPRASCLSEATLGLSDNFDLVRAAMIVSPHHYKLLRKNDDPEELYNLDSDPGELTKLSLTDPANAAVLATLRAILYP